MSLLSMMAWAEKQGIGPAQVRLAIARVADMPISHDDRSIDVYVRAAAAGVTDRAIRAALRSDNEEPDPLVRKKGKKRKMKNKKKMSSLAAPLRLVNMARLERSVSRLTGASRSRRDPPVSAEQNACARALGFASVATMQRSHARAHRNAWDESERSGEDIARMNSSEQIAERLGLGSLTPAAMRGMTALAKAAAVARDQPPPPTIDLSKLDPTGIAALVAAGRLGDR